MNDKDKQIMNDIDIRLLDASEWTLAFPIMVQLRDKHVLDTFIESVTEQSTRLGYQIYGAFSEGKLIGVAGVRPVRTLARGHFLHVDDLVIDQNLRVGGAGRKLLTYIHNLAKSQGMTAIFLDSRPDAEGFYDKMGYVRHSSPSMRRHIS